MTMLGTETLNVAGILTFYIAMFSMPTEKAVVGSSSKSRSFREPEAAKLSGGALSHPKANLLTELVLAVVSTSLLGLHLALCLVRITQLCSGGQVASSLFVGDQAAPLWAVDIFLAAQNLLLYLACADAFKNRPRVVEAGADFKQSDGDMDHKLEKSDASSTSSDGSLQQLPLATAAADKESDAEEEPRAAKTPRVANLPANGCKSTNGRRRTIGRRGSFRQPRRASIQSDTATMTAAASAAAKTIETSVAIPRNTTFSTRAALTKDTARAGVVRRKVRRDSTFQWTEATRLQDLARLARNNRRSFTGELEPHEPRADSDDWQGVEILHVDDDPVQHVVLSKWLRRYKDTTVTTVNSGESALALLQTRLESAAELPTLIVMDQVMPGMSGTRTARKIRELCPGAPLPIIITSGLDADEIRSTCEYVNSGVNDIISKPINKQSLTTTIVCQLNLAALQRRTNLLQSILPDSIINRLVAGQRVIADKHECVSIIFTDIVGYTGFSARTHTPDLIGVLNDMFTSFDRLTEKHGVYKVETIGDAYMAAAGHEAESEADHAQRLIAMAKDMLAAVDDIEMPDGSQLKIRVGIHTGPAYAGVVGEKCPRYCFFGDTVNTASRMESTSFSQCIQVSESTFRKVAGPGKDSEAAADFHPLGGRAVKGKGIMETFLVKAGDWETAANEQ